MRATILVSAAALAVGVLSISPSWAQDQTTLSVKSSGEYGQYIADDKGMSLYMFTTDEEGEGGKKAVSKCYDKCAQNWPPLVVQGKPQAGDMVQADQISTIERKDGSMQVTYGGYPLYYFHNDAGPGDTKGQGVGDKWYLVAPSGEEIEKKM